MFVACRSRGHAQLVRRSQQTRQAASIVLLVTVKPALRQGGGT